ncbi:pentatricopeptide repeat-containing protein At4g19191, mitochondrial [Cornus florida]|uniref:pentatricopeptide repeat-containing protein At4g19191, mitochondrial n=1 Tax=Cornus florida TaxID=4283 RepID=UPI00289FF2D8|nr:pentatricopeptide repeat-containing protein At4g19191, mitochondrial [Cornus florida]
MLKSTVTPNLYRLSYLSNVGHWNSSIGEAVNQGQSQKALALFRQMKQNGLEPNNLTFPFIAKACGKLSKPSYSQIIHAHVAKSPFQSDIYVQTALVDMYVKCNHLNRAYDLFVKMLQRDVTSWNAMILGFAQSGHLDRVLILFNEMRLDGIRPDSVTVMGLTQLSSSTKNLKLVTALHSFGIRIGLETEVSVANTWIAAYSKCGDLRVAELLFDGIGAGFRTVVSFNSLIAGYSHLKKSFKAISFYKRMLFDGFHPDTSTIVSLLSSCVQPEALYHGKLIHSHAIQLGCDFDVSVLNTLISMYSKSGDISSARYVFDSIINKTCVSWTAMIGGYAEKGDLDEALVLFYSMEASGEKPDLVTMLYLISGCGQMGALEIGRWVDLYTTTNGLKNIMVCNALIDMYAKCGSIRDAQELFRTMHERTIVSWTTMIAGCALNGEFKEALDLFFHMLEFGLKPNHITFLAVLQACSHAGFLEKGWECFDLMTKVYRINPGLDHYSCMADLLGRRGKLKEALEFIQNMPVKPDAGVWGTLLSACKNHRNVEIGEYAAHRLFEEEPQAAAPYVEMANIYASTRRWDGVAAIRKMMKCNQVTKSPGQSHLLVNGKSHAFTVQDRCHPEGSLIYEALDCLVLHLKEEGYSSHSEEPSDLEQI